MCLNAPVTFRLWWLTWCAPRSPWCGRPPARAISRVAARLTATPARATPRTVPPLVGGGVTSRRLSRLTAGRHLPAGRRAVLAAGFALADSGSAGAGKARPRGPHGGRRTHGIDRFPHRPVPCAIGARRRRSGPRLRRAGPRLQPAPFLGYRRLRLLLPGGRFGVHGGVDPRNRQPGARLYGRDREFRRPRE